MAPLPAVKTVVSTLLLLVLLCYSVPAGTANEQTYTARNQEEVNVLSLVVSSEIKTNKWSTSELICFSVNGLNPSAALVKSLRQGHSNVRSAAEWPKRFNCGFELQLEYTQFDLSRDIKVRSKVVDLRDINKGEAHIATLMKDGEYSFHRVDGKWSVRDYTAKPLASQ
jgi:hypothetical protein